MHVQIPGKSTIIAIKSSQKQGSAVQQITQEQKLKMREKNLSRAKAATLHVKTIITSVMNGSNAEENNGHAGEMNKSILWTDTVVIALSLYSFVCFLFQ